MPSPSVSTTTYTVTVTNNGCTDTDQVTVFVNNAVANAGPDQTICLGQSVSLTATGGGSLPMESFGLGNTATVNANPSVTTTYTVTVTNNGCTDTDQVTVFVNNAVANAGPDQTICLGQSVSLTATGGGSYQWSHGLGNTATVNANPSVTTTYTVTVTNNGCTDTDQVTVFVNNAVANAGPDQTICLGQSVSLTATGGGSLSVESFGLGNTATVNASPVSTTTYTVTVTNNGCTDTDQVTVFVNNAVANAGPDQTICLGQSVSLTATGGGSLPMESFGLGNTATVNANPSVTTTYTVTVTNNGCTDTDQVTVFVNNAVANAGPDQTICLGQSVSLTATGGGSLSVESFGLGNTATVNANPSVSTTTYTVTVTNNGCTDTDQVTVFVNNAVANAGPDQTICLGQSVSLTATGGGSYQWSHGLGNTATVNASPVSTTTYTVTVTNNGCTDTDQVTVFVNNAVANAGPDQTICLGQSVSLTATGGGSLPMESFGLGNTATVNANPSVTTTYTVTVTNNGCTDTDQVTVFVNNAVANAGPDQTICLGQSVSLTATGGGSLSVESFGLGNTATVNANPSVTTTYTVTVTNNGCTDTDQVTVFVNNAVANAGPDQTICLGQSVSLTATGGGSYQWSHGLGNTATVNANPVSTTTYTVTVTNNGCTDTDQVTVFVNNAVANAGPDQTICLGQSVSLTATGGGSYQWSHGLGNTATVNANPSVTTTYTVTVTNNGCTDTDQVTVFVNNAVANAGPDQTICLGQSVSLTATGGGFYQWSHSLGNTATVNASPVSTTTYTVTVTNNGCTDTDQVTVFVNNAVANAGPDQTICLGQSVSLTATGGGSYQWSHGLGNTATVNASPVSTTTYTVTVTNNGCTDTDQVTVFVNNAVANAGPDQTICLGDCVPLTATGGTAYQWSDGSFGATITVCPTTTTTYFVTVTNNGCTDVEDVTVFVSSVTADAGPDQTICQGSSTFLTASGGVEYIWSTGETTSTIEVSPSGTQNYYVVVINEFGCSDVAHVQVMVQTGNLFADAGPDQITCAGDFVTLTATGGVDYEWSNGMTSSQITVNPAVTTTYSVTVTDPSGCFGVDHVTVFVTQVNANAGPDQTMCLGKQANLFATGGTSYFWSTGQSGQSIIVEPTVSTLYVVTVTDSNGCTDTDDVFVTVTSVNADAGPDVEICSGSETTLTASGGVSYAWSTGSTSASINVHPTTTTTYTVIVTNADGCVGTDEVTVSIGGSLQVADNRSCENAKTTGMYDVFIVASNGSAPYQIVAENPDGVLFSETGNMTGSANFSVPNTDVGYVVTVTDASGCEAVINQLGLEPCLALSVEWLDFVGEVTEEGNELTWITATEVSNDYFTVYYSTDGNDFVAIGEVAGAGHSNTTIEYGFTHNDPKAGIGYYYLVQTDYDGAISKSDIITLNRREAGLAFVSVTNVTPGTWEVVFNSNTEEELTATLYDITGKLMRTVEVTSQNGMNTFRMDLNNFSKGIYIISLNNGVERITTKVIKESH